MQVDGITGVNLICAQSASGRSNALSNIHLVTCILIKPWVYKNFPEGIAHLKDGTFEEYWAVIGDSGEETATTVAYSDPPSSYEQPTNKGKGKVPAYSTPNNPVPLFSNTAVDGNNNSNSDASGDAFFLGSYKSVQKSFVPAPTCYSIRLANKNSTSTLLHTPSFDPLSSTFNTLLKTVVARVAAAYPATTSITMGSTLGIALGSATTTVVSSDNSAGTSVSKKRPRTPSPTTESSKCRRITEGTGTVQEPFLLDNNEDWLPSIMTKPHGLPTLNKIKQDPWSALKDINN